MEGRVQLIEDRDLAAHIFRRVFLATLITSPLTFTACSSVEPAPDTAPEVVEVATSPTVPPEAVAPLSAELLELVAADAPVEEVVPPGPERFADLFERIRAGYRYGWSARRERQLRRVLAALRAARQATPRTLAYWRPARAKQRGAR